ncbi:ferrous iron transport protein A [Oscillochloris sp. ZM17-4]|uniref:FeoA family protein n=1 Tax=Oscillochloris sp. ZM17-4 TaxID=2866714 RepID=UPI001C72FF7A|nr:FeoA family protein [Oscillochloris sp. ZM17-4]MBX0329624.1 ferrous iron transport protein A [Oscillochloris sp. ZM17-4]
MTLADLPLGARAQVLALGGAGAERRRLLDLGILPGTVISVESRSPLGDPTAYRVRDTVIALRREQAARITVRSEI